MGVVQKYADRRWPTWPGSRKWRIASPRRGPAGSTWSWWSRRWATPPTSCWPSRVSITDRPARRELDMLLSAGERISMALLDGAERARRARGQLHRLAVGHHHERRPHERAHRGGAAVPRTGRARPRQGRDRGRLPGRLVQEGSHDAGPRRLRHHGRGAAAALGAEACEIYSDVDGIYSADPRVVPGRAALRDPYEEMQELAEAGAKVLNAQAVEFAKEAGIAIYARASSGSERADRRPPLSAARLPGAWPGVASETGLMLLEAGPFPPRDARSRRCSQLLDERGIAGKQLQPPRGGDGQRAAPRRLPPENLHDFKRTSSLSPPAVFASRGESAPSGHRHGDQRHVRQRAPERSRRSPNRTWSSSACRPRASGSACSSRSARWMPR